MAVEAFTLIGCVADLCAVFSSAAGLKPNNRTRALQVMDSVHAATQPIVTAYLVALTEAENALRDDKELADVSRIISAAQARLVAVRISLEAQIEAAKELALPNQVVRFLPLLRDVFYPESSINRRLVEEDRRIGWSAMRSFQSELTSARSSSVLAEFARELRSEIQQKWSEATARYHHLRNVTETGKFG